MNWDLSCPDWAERLANGQSLVPYLPKLDLVTGNRAVGILDKLRLHDVPGNPRLGPVLDIDPPGSLGDAGGDWFRDIVRALFGSIDPATRHRLIREVFLLVPKKNGKTTYGALLMLVALLMNTTPGAKFIFTAPVQDTAEMALEAASQAVEMDEVLKTKLWVRDHKSQIVHRVTKATLEIMTFDPKVLTGQKVHGALIDELHLCALINGAAKAIRQLRGGMLPFPQAFMMFITTQSEDQPAGIFRNELVRARDIRDGKIRDGVPMLPVLYEFPEEIQRDKDKAWENPSLWPMVNPNLGRGFQLSTLEEMAVEAKRAGTSEFKAWASQHINIEIGLALAARAWAGARYWEACGAKEVTLEYLLARSEVVTIGIDGGGLDDLLGVSVIGREEGTGRWLVYCHAWVHESVLELRKDIAARLQDFANDGDLTIIKKPGDDIDALAKLVERCEKSELLGNIGVDTVGLGAIVDAIVGVGIDFERLQGIPQGYKLMGYIQTVERKLAAEQIAHSGRPMMAWCVSNAKPEPRGNATMITKQVSGSAKIDPLMALFNAAALMSMNPKPKKKKHQLFFVGA